MNVLLCEMMLTPQLLQMTDSPSPYPETPDLPLPDMMGTSEFLTDDHRRMVRIPQWMYMHSLFFLFCNLVKKHSKVSRVYDFYSIRNCMPVLFGSGDVLTYTDSNFRDHISTLFFFCWCSVLFGFLFQTHLLAFKTVMTSTVDSGKPDNPFVCSH
jgi:hypothetical protein